MKCENCNLEHDGNYASGRFCSSKCSRSFSSKNNRIERNKKISNSIKAKINSGLRVGFAFKSNLNVVEKECDICNTIFITKKYPSGFKKKTCSKVCASKLRLKSYNDNKHKNVGGYRRGSGRGKSGWYKGYWCDSSYELAFVIYNIENDIVFERNTEYFIYKFEGNKRKYYPDFKIDNVFYEIKGYLTNQDKIKHEQLKGNLIVLLRENMTQIFDYVESKYGKDFIKLFEGDIEKYSKCKICGKSCKSRKTVYCSRSCAGKAVSYLIHHPFIYYN